jgi:hypothetical protein
MSHTIAPRAHPAAGTPAAMDAQEGILGTWNVVYSSTWAKTFKKTGETPEGTEIGTPIDADDIARLQLETTAIITKDLLFNCKYKLDPAKTPKTFDLLSEDGKALLALGVYEPEGDRLRLRMSMTPQRPAKVTDPRKEGEQSGDVYVVLQRAGDVGGLSVNGPKMDVGSHIDQATGTDVPWGDWNAGWSARLRAAKNTWTLEELPEFTVDLRKRDKGEPDVVRQSLHNWWFEVDERRFRFSLFTTSWEHNKVFEPGTTQEGFVTFRFHRDETGLHVQTTDGGKWINSYNMDPLGQDGQVLSGPPPAESFEWTRGKHVVRMAFPVMQTPPAGRSWEEYLAFSNPEEVQIKEKPLSLRRASPPTDLPKSRFLAWQEYQHRGGYTDGVISTTTTNGNGTELQSEATKEKVAGRALLNASRFLANLPPDEGAALIGLLKTWA